MTQETEPRQPGRHRRPALLRAGRRRVEVAAPLKDGNAANGEADVIVASFHAGAAVGTGTRRFEKEIAKGGDFARMAASTGSVDVIFNGHTHQAYAWAAPSPAAADPPDIQTGEYGNNVGQIMLTVDAGTDTSPAYRQERRPQRPPRTSPTREWPRSRPSWTPRWPRPRSWATSRSASSPPTSRVPTRRGRQRQARRGPWLRVAPG